MSGESIGQVRSGGATSAPTLAQGYMRRALMQVADPLRADRYQLS